MVEREAKLDRVFHALSDGTRRRMLRRLAGGEHSVGELAAGFEMSFAAGAKHVKVLENAGLVRRRIMGRVHLCRLEARRLKKADEWLRFYERFWSDSLDRLEMLLEQDAAADARSKGEK